MSVVAEAAPEEGPSGIEQSLFESSVPAGDFSLAHTQPGGVIFDTIHPNPIERDAASSYLSSDFGLYMSPNTISSESVQEIGILRGKMLELRAAAQQAETVEMLPKTSKTSAAYEQSVSQMHQIIIDIADLKLVHGGQLQSQFDGVVPKELSPENKLLSGIFFILSYKKADMLTTRGFVKRSLAIVSEIKPTKDTWDELAEKYDTFINRLDMPQRHSAMKLLPTPVRLMAYGHRLEISNKPDEYYFDIADQCDDIERFDDLLDELRVKVRKGISYDETREIFFSMLQLSFLHGETGAFRERDDFLKQYDSGTHRGLLFILRAVENIGIDGAGEMNKWIHSLGLVSRSVMGKLPSEMGTVSPLLVDDDERRRKPEEYEALEQSFRRTAHSMGSSTS